MYGAPQIVNGGQTGGGVSINLDTPHTMPQVREHFSGVEKALEGLSVEVGELEARLGDAMRPTQPETRVANPVEGHPPTAPLASGLRSIAGQIQLLTVRVRDLNHRLEL